MKKRKERKEKELKTENRPGTEWGKNAQRKREKKRKKEKKSDKRNGRERGKEKRGFP